MVLLDGARLDYGSAETQTAASWVCTVQPPQEISKLLVMIHCGGRTECRPKALAVLAEDCRARASQPACCYRLCRSLETHSCVHKVSLSCTGRKQAPQSASANAQTANCQRCQQVGGLSAGMHPTCLKQANEYAPVVEDGRRRCAGSGPGRRAGLKFGVRELPPGRLPASALSRGVPVVPYYVVTCHHFCSGPSQSSLGYAPTQHCCAHVIRAIQPLRSGCLQHEFARVTSQKAAWSQLLAQDMHRNSL
jgi:hypothetical protein